MGWISAAELKAKRNYVKGLEDNNAGLLKKLNNQTREFDEIINDKNRGCSVVLDFYNTDVFSIERNEGRTIVGHWITTTDELQKRQIRQWYYYCSTEVHEKLVAEYRAHMKQEYDD